MRNLIEYPITTVEIEQCLKRLAEEIGAEKNIGDMRPLLLRTAAQIVSRSAFVMHGLADLPARPTGRRRYPRALAAQQQDRQVEDDIQ